MRSGERFAEALQRGRSHHRVAQPIDAAHEYAARVERAGGRRSCHDPAPGFRIVGAASDLTTGALGPESGGWGPGEGRWGGDAHGGRRDACPTIVWFPTSMHPEPIGRVAMDSRFEGPVH